MKSKIVSLLLLSALIFCSQSANAQTAAPIPVDTEAGAITKEIKVKNSEIDPVLEKTKQEKAKDEADFKMRVDQTKEEKSQIKKSGFTLNSIYYQGNTVYTTEELDTVNVDYLNKYVTLNDLKTIMNNISKYYEEQGYITTFAYLPAQKIQSGILKVAIVEGKVGEIKIKGNKWTKTNYLKNNLLKANGLKEDHVFNVNSLKKTLGKINETNYLKGRAILNKGVDPDTAEITLEVEDRFPLMFRAGYNNQGRQLIGKQRAGLTIGNENITGYGDRLYGTTTLANETFGLNTNYYLPLGPYGTELRLGYDYTNVLVGKAYKNLGFKGKAHGLNVGLIQPIHEGETFKLTSDLTFDMTEVNLYQNKTFLRDRHNIRALRAGINAIKDDSKGRWISRMEASVGLPMWGASTNGTGDGADSKFARFNPSLIRVHALPCKTTGILKVAGQFSPNALLPSEQIQMGGMHTVRGFDEGVMFAQNAYYMNLEFRKAIPFLPDFKYLKLKDNVQLAAFYDNGLAKVRNVKLTSKSFLQSVGFGFRIHLTDYLNANLDFGFPLGDSVTDARKDAMKFHFSINSDII